MHVPTRSSGCACASGKSPFVRVGPALDDFGFASMPPAPVGRPCRFGELSRQSSSLSCSVPHTPARSSLGCAYASGDSSFVRMGLALQCSRHHKHLTEKLVRSAMAYMRNLPEKVKPAPAAPRSTPQKFNIRTGRIIFGVFEVLSSHCRGQKCPLFKAHKNRLAIIRDF